MAIFANGVYEPDTVAGILRRIPKTGSISTSARTSGLLRFQWRGSDPTCTSSASRPILAWPRSCDAMWRTIRYPMSPLPNALPDLAPGKRSGSTRLLLENLEWVPSGRSSIFLPCFLGRSHWTNLLDDLGIDDVDVMKLDVEGSELGCSARTEHAGSPDRGPPRSCLSSATGPKSGLRGRCRVRHKLSCIRLAIVHFNLGVAEMTGAPVDQPLSTGSAMLLVAALRGIATR